MNNGRAQRISAKELTRQIDQETDLGLAVGAEGQSFGGVMSVVSEQVATDDARMQAEQLGWKVLDGGRRELAGDLSQEAAQEVARDEAELTHPERFVGDETPLQVQENLEAQAENLRNEEDPKRDFEARIVAKSEEELARVAMREVEKFTHKGVFSPADVVKMHRILGDRALSRMENPHPIGRGNG